MSFPCSSMDPNSNASYNLNILNWNANGLKTQRILFLAFLSRYNIDIACISETHLSMNEPFKTPGYQTYRNDRKARVASGGVAIIIKKNLTHYEGNNIDTINLEAIAAHIKLNNGNYLKIVCGYKQPNKQLLEQDIQTIFNCTGPTLLIGDLNCKNTVWGCRQTNPNGIKLNEYASKHCVQIAAPEEYTYFPYRDDHQPDILDIVVHKNFAEQLNQTVYAEMNSDHDPVIISSETEPIPRYSSPRLINGIVDWKKFQENIDTIIETYTQPLNTTRDIDIHIEKLTPDITTCIQQTTKTRNRRKADNYRIPPKHVIELIKQKSKIRREWQRTRDPALKNRVNNLSHRIKRELDEHRIQSYQSLIADLQPGDPGLWRTTKKILGKTQQIPVITDGNQAYCTDEDKCHAFADLLEKVFNPQPTCPPGFLNHVCTQVETQMPSPGVEIEETTAEELKMIIKNLPIKKAPGHDKIPNIILKNATDKLVDYLVVLINACLKLGYFPKSWKLSHIMMFPKPGKNNKQITSYRPISLLTTLSKLLEKVIHIRLTDHIERIGLIPHFQFGFRKGHSTCHQLQHLVEQIEDSFEQKQYTPILFIDVAQAFDSVWHNGLKYKISRSDIPHYLTAILYSFLDDRTFKTIINNTASTIRKICAGVPQGSILGPLLFNIYTHDIPDTESNIMMFADDTAVYTRDWDLTRAINKLQVAVNIITRWFHKWNLQINNEKCVAKIFTLRQVNNPQAIYIDNNPISWKNKGENVKYLGVHLDTKLTWKPHITNKLNQSYARLNQLYPLINRKSSLKTKSTLLLYKSLIRPLVMYACVIWGNASNTHLKNIQVLQNKLLRISVNAEWFVTNNQLHRELGVSKISEHIQKLTQKFHENLINCESAVFYQLGQKNIHTRLKRKLAQDIHM